MTPLHLYALRALEASVRLGSFRAAGEELGVTPAAVGQQVRRLEEAVGRALLVRRANGFEATEIARAAAARLGEGLLSLREATAMMRRDSAPLRLAISVAPTMAERWLAPRLGLFLADQPEIDLRIDSTNQLREHGQGAGDYDFALRYAPPSTAAVFELDLFREYLLPVCTPDLARKLRPEDRKNTFRDVPLLRVDKETSDPHWIGWDEWGERFGYAVPQQGLQFTRTTLALRSAYGGYGLHLAQLSLVLPDLQGGVLVAPFGARMVVLTGHPYRLIAFGERNGSPLHSAFVSWMEQEARNTAKSMSRYLAA